MISKVRLILDLKESQNFDTMILHRGDSNSRVIEIELTDNHVPVTLTANMSATIDASTDNVVVADGESATVDTDKNIILFTITDTMTSLPGQSKISLTVKEGDSVITAQTFRAIVTDSIINENSKFNLSGGTVKQIIDQINKNIEKKADKATTIAGYGITNAYTKNEVDSKVDGVEKSANRVSEKTSITDESINYPSIEYLKNFYYDFSETDNLLGKKADKATTIAGYGITDAYTKSEVDSKVDGVEKSANKVSEKTSITDESIDYPSIEYLKNYYYEFSETDNLLGEKADKATTIAGYGITDAYTKSEVDSKVDGVEKSANKIGSSTDITDESINYPSIEYLKNYYYDFSETDNLLGEKYDASNIEYGIGTPTVASYFPNSVKSADFVYQRIGKFVTVNINAEFNKYSGNQVGFYGFPYANQIANGSKGVCISSLYSQNNNIKWLNDKSWLLITTDNSNGFSDGEKINFTFTYPIS